MATEPGTKSENENAATPTRAKGKAINRSEGEIIELSVISDADVQESRDDWKEKTIPKYRELIDAEKDE